MMINWEHYRSLFPVVKDKTYFMTAGGGALPQPVLQAIIDRYQVVASQGGRAFGDNIAIMERCREKIAKLINAEKEHIAFIPNVSFGMNALAHSLPQDGSILLTKNDFSSSVLPWKNTQHKIKWISTAADLISELSEHSNDDLSAVVASYIHFANGYRLPIEEIKTLNEQAHLIVNGTQAIGSFPIDVQKQQIDALLCSCYKWMGCGEGIAFMYIHPEFFKKLTPTFIGWRSVQSAMSFDGEYQLYNSARVFELGWDNMTIFAGCEAALDLIDEIKVPNIVERIIELSTYLVNGLQSLNIPLMTQSDPEYRSGIVLIGPFDDMASIVSALEQRNIWTTQRDGGIRISLHYFNNKQDIDNLLKAFSEVAHSKQ